MKKLTTLKEIITGKTGRFSWHIAAGWLLLASCSKTADTPVSNIPASVSIQSVQASASAVTLLQGNNSRTALSLSWQTTSSKPNAASYTVEATVGGLDFSNAVTLGTTDQNSLGFCNDVLNQKISQLIGVSNTALISFRVRVMQADGSVNFSSVIGARITTYQPIIKYTYPQFIKLPGNYQDWNLNAAPQVVSVNNDGEYQGYITFTNQYPQLMFVKGTDWSPLNTFTCIGGNKFGFGGSVLSVFGGAGTYLVKVSTNTNTWSYTKINNWVLTGTALSGGTATMQQDPATGNWSINTYLNKGSFRINSGSTKPVSMGQSTVNGYTVPAETGTDFNVPTPGYYQVSLNLAQAGNYVCNFYKTANQSQD